MADAFPGSTAIIDAPLACGAQDWISSGSFCVANSEVGDGDLYQCAEVSPLSLALSLLFPLPSSLPVMTNRKEYEHSQSNFSVAVFCISQFSRSTAKMQCHQG
jgi:hypothetical protein